MRKILSWFGSRTFNKVIIFANLTAFAVNIYGGLHWFAVLWLLLALSWIVIDGYQKRLRRVCDIAESNDICITQYVRSINLERVKVLYYICLYSKEKLIADYCKKYWVNKDSKKFIRELQNAEKSVQAASELLQERLKEYDNDGKDNETETKGAE